MRTSTTRVTKAQLSLLHVLKNGMGMDDEDWRSMLHVRYGVKSSRDLHVLEANELIDSLKNGRDNGRGRASDSQLRYMLQLARNQGVVGSILGQWIENVTGHGLESAELSRTQCSKLIEAFKARGRKIAGKRG